jgi:nondiscriminating glutamyl-tRNA synthetase
MTVRTRYAPSPTGDLHVGGAWMAFFNWLFARHAKGQFVLRIEDTDRSRSTEEYERSILADLRWLGIDWDEGPDVGGPYGPYRQTERGPLYQAQAKVLIERGAAYPCYCTREEIEADRKLAAAEHRPPRYSGRCRNLTPEERRQREAEGRTSTLRFRVPDDHPPIIVHDLVLGRVEFASADLDDFIILRSDGSPLYNFANVIDDHGMHITDIVRGSEHLSNTPRQFLMYEAFGWGAPRVAHLPVLLGVDRKKLSKRHGDTSVREYASQGILPEALVNFFALMGWYPEDGRELFTVPELIERFRIEEMGKSGAVFDVQKLHWMNGVYMQAAYRQNPDRIIGLVIDCLTEQGLLDGAVTPEQRAYVGRVVAIMGERLRLPRDILTYGDFFFRPDADYARELERDPAAVRSFVATGGIELLRHLREALQAVDPFSRASIEEAVLRVGKASGVGPKVINRLLRAAITNKSVGPGLFELIEVLGKDRTLTRLETVIKIAESAEPPAATSR